MGKTEKTILRSTGEQVRIVRRHHHYTDVMMPNGGIQTVQNRKLVHIKPQRTAHSLSV